MMLPDVYVAVFTQNPDLYEKLERTIRGIGIPVAQFSYNDRMDALERWSHGAHLIVLFDGSQQPQVCLRWINRLSEDRPNTVSVWIDSELTQSHVADAMRAGARDLLIGEIKAEEIESLINRLGFEHVESPGASRVIAAMGAAGGAGATTLVTNLAVEIARQEKVSVGVLDLDPFVSGVGLLLNVRPDTTLFDVREKAGDLDVAVIRRMAARHSSGVSLVASQGWSPDHLPIPGLLIRRVIVLMQQLFPYLLIDVPRGMGLISRAVSDSTEAVLLVGQYSITAAAGLRTMRQCLEDLNYPKHRILLVANSVSDPEALSLRQWTQLMAHEPFAKIPFDPATVNQAAADGICVTDVSARSAISKSIQRLAHDLCALLRGQPEAQSHESAIPPIHVDQHRVAVLST